METNKATSGLAGRGAKADRRRAGQGVLGMLALGIVAACASTKLTSVEPYTGGRLPKPDRIIVYDFGATPEEVPTDSALSEHTAEATPQTAEDVELGKKLGAEVAKQLTANLQEMGLPAVQAAGQPPPKPNDIVIKGNFYAVEEGSTAKRVMVGFGSGSADLRTAVEVYQMTPQGLRKLGGGSSDSEGGKAPGMVAPVLLFAATHNPIGLIVVGATKLHDQRTGANTIEAAGKRTADAIAARLKEGAQKQGWI